MPPAAQNDHRKHSAVTDFCTNGDSEDNPKKSRGGVLGPRRDSARSIAGRHLQAKAPSTSRCFLHPSEEWWGVKILDAVSEKVKLAWLRNVSAFLGLGAD